MSNDKGKAVTDFISTYEGISNSPIFVNFINAKDNGVQIMTTSNEVYLNKTFVDGSVMKRYTFSIVVTRSITDMAVIRDEMVNENIDDLADIQSFMDWINEQGELENYPNFGDACLIEKMHTTAENPSLDGINAEVSPALALYSIEIRIDYIDYSKIIWS